MGERRTASAYSRMLAETYSAKSERDDTGAARAFRLADRPETVCRGHPDGQGKEGRDEPWMIREDRDANQRRGDEDGNTQ